MKKNYENTESFNTDCIFFNEDKAECKALTECKCKKCKFFKKRTDQRELRLRAEYEGRFNNG